eukprot:4630361-Amphidinium_carterae.1
MDQHKERFPAGTSHHGRAPVTGDINSDTLLARKASRYHVRTELQDIPKSIAVAMWHSGRSQSSASQPKTLGERCASLHCMDGRSGRTTFALAQPNKLRLCLPNNENSLPPFATCAFQLSDTPFK